MSVRVSFLLSTGVLLLSRVLAVAEQSWALRYSYDNQQVFVEDSDSLDVTGPLTVEAWVKPEAGIQEKWLNFIVSKQMSGTGYTLLSSGFEDNHFYFEAGEAYVSAVSASQTPLDQWVHVAGVWEAGELRIYVGGQLDGVQASPNVPEANELPLWIGASPFGGDTNWRGAIDEVRVWGVARTEAEIQWDMFHPLPGSEPGLRAYWNFDEGTGQVLHDLANGNHGRLGESWESDGFDPEWVPGVPVPEPGALSILLFFGAMARARRGASLACGSGP
jgi:hypothetical protein